jgi:hypothetical protein
MHYHNNSSSNPLALSLAHQSLVSDKQFFQGIVI